MKTSIKRVLAFLLAFAFVFGEMPLSTLAATTSKVRLTIVYEMPDGCETPAPASQKVTGEPGEAYVVSSPKVEGFKAEKDAVYGNLGKTNETITVKYSPIYYVARVKYEVPTGFESKKPKNKHKTGSPGTKYSFKTPTIEGLIPDKEYIEGEIKNQDETFTVTYYANENTVTVNYEVPEGFTAPASDRAVGIPGKEYEIKPPTLKGLTPDRKEVKGKIGKADETITVKYTKDKHSITVHFEVPAGYEAQKPKDVTKTEPIGTEVTIDIPKIEGLSTTGTKVVGNIGYEDEEITVRYTDKLYTVVVQYRVPDGYQDKMPKQQSKTGLMDEDFTFPVPKIEGLRADYPETDQTVKIGNGSSLGDYRIILVTYKEATYKVRVNYVTPVGFDMEEANYKEKSGLRPGETYSIKSPEVSGCYLDKDDLYVTGEIADQDVEVTVTYKEAAHWAWVDYVVPAGYEDKQPERQVGTGAVDEEFSFKSPTIAGLKPDQDEVTGKYKKTDQSFTVTYSLDDGPCPKSTDGLHNWTIQTELDDGSWGYSGSYKLYPRPVEGSSRSPYNFGKRRTICNNCGLVVGGEYYCDLSANNSGYYHSTTCFSGVSPYIDHGMYCRANDCPHGVSSVNGHHSGVGPQVTAGQHYRTDAGLEFDAPSSGTADDGKEFAAGDTIQVCQSCGHVLRVISRNPDNIPITTCIVRYVVPEGYSRGSGWVRRMRRVGEEVTIDSPQIAGLAPDQDSITHTFTEEDAEYTVTYYPIEGYSVTVNYEVPEGFTKPESKTLEGLTYKMSYSVPSPILDGLRPDISSVYGTIEGQNVTQTVTYTPSQHINVHLKFPADYTKAKDMDVTYYYDAGEHYRVYVPTHFTDLDYYVEDNKPLEGTMPDATLDITVQYYYNTNAVVTHKLTIHYLWPYGEMERIAKDYTMDYAEGARYEVKSPDIEYMQPSIETVSGTMGQADVEVNVTYTDTHRYVEIEYQVPAGYQKPRDESHPVKIGSEFAFKSATVDGLVANKPIVKGKMGKVNQTFTVKFEFPTSQLAPYKLTVNYTVPDKYAQYKPESYTGNYYEGTTYKAPIPDLSNVNLTPSVDKVEGTMPDNDLTLEVSYRPIDEAYYYVIVHFDIPGGYEQREDFKMTGQPGTGYTIYAPHIPGLMVTDKSDVLSGKFKAEDQEFTFHYAEACTVYIKYFTNEGKLRWPNPPNYWACVPSGTHIVVESPNVPGWAPENPYYETIDIHVSQDEEYEVEYVLGPIVTVNYEYTGKHKGEVKIPEPHIKTVRQGDTYRVDTPPIEGLTPDLKYVLFEDVQNDRTATVYYDDKVEEDPDLHNVDVYFKRVGGARDYLGTKTVRKGETYHIDAPSAGDYSAYFEITPSEFDGVMGDADITVTFTERQIKEINWYEILEGDDQTVSETERDDGTPEVNQSAQFKINADPEKVTNVTDGNGKELKEGKDYTIKGSGSEVNADKLSPDESTESLTALAADGATDIYVEQTERLTADSGTTVIELTASYLDSLGPGQHMLLVGFTDGGAVMSFTIEGSEKWNLFEDGSAHDFTVKGISASKEAVNMNKTSAKFFDATLSENNISVSLKAGADRKKAANANTFDFDLGEEGTVSYVLPLTYNKPVLKLSSTKGTVKKGTETTLTTTVLYQTENGSYLPYDLSDAAVTYAGQSVTASEDGLVSIVADGKRSGKIAITKDKWNAKDPVTLNYSVAEVKADKDVLAIDMGGLKQVTLNTNAPEQSFTFPLSFNGAPATADTVTIAKGKKGEEALGSIGDGTLTVSLGRSGIKKGSYTLNLTAGKAKLPVKIKVSDKALNSAVTGKVTQKYDVVTRKPMVIVPTLKEMQGSITNAAVSAITLKKGTAPATSDFTARVKNGNIEVSYSGSELNAKNLKVGDMTLTLTVRDNDGNNLSIPMTVKNVSAKKTTPSVKSVKVTIPKASAEKADGTTVIGSANIISTYKDSAKHVQTIAPAKVELSCKNVEARPDGNNGKILITKLTGNSGTVKATLTYPGGVTKTVTISVKKGK